ncbi:MAG: PHB depolymerase family esterase [Myxococcales bacterium]|nr:PHB depolymerase family esterase [Myxococcales bacterium]
MRMFLYTPSTPRASAPLVVVLHGCELDAQNYAYHAGWNTLADAHGFYVVLPQQSASNNQNRCFNWFAAGDTQRGSGEAGSIAQMVTYMRDHYGVDSKQIYASGMSAGGAMVAALLAAYPDVFAGGAISAGVPYGCASSVFEAFTCMDGVDQSASQWAAEVRAADSSYSGPYPKVALFHGKSDTLVAYANLAELVEQWTAVHGADQTPDETTAIGAHQRLRFKDAKGQVVVEAYQLSGMDHGLAIDPAEGGVAGYGVFHPVHVWAPARAIALWGIQ